MGQGRGALRWVDDPVRRQDGRFQRIERYVFSLLENLYRERGGKGGQ